MQIIGPVMAVEFPDGKLPKILDAVVVALPDGCELVAEVHQHLGGNRVRTVAM